MSLRPPCSQARLVPFRWVVTACFCPGSSLTIRLPAASSLIIKPPHHSHTGRHTSSTNHCHQSLLPYLRRGDSQRTVDGSFTVVRQERRSNLRFFLRLHPQ